MNLQEEMRDFFKKNHLYAILDDPIRFKIELDIGEKAFRWLKNKDHIEMFAGMISSGLGASAVTATAWWAGAGTFTQVALGLGIATVPFGTFALVGGGVAAAYCCTKKASSYVDNKCMSKIPKRITTPLNQLADFVAKLIILPSLEMSRSDGKIDKVEIDQIYAVLVKDFGYKTEFVDQCISQYRMEEFSKIAFAKELKIVCDRLPELDGRSFCIKLISILKKIQDADSVVHDSEVHFLNSFSSTLADVLNFNVNCFKA